MSKWAHRKQDFKSLEVTFIAFKVKSQMLKNQIQEMEGAEQTDEKNPLAHLVSR